MPNSSSPEESCPESLCPLPLTVWYLQLYRCAPAVLLPVLPHLRSELDSDSEPRRSAAVGLMVRLYCLPGSDVVSEPYR